MHDTTNERMTMIWSFQRALGGDPVLASLNGSFLYSTKRYPLGLLAMGQIAMPRLGRIAVESGLDLYLLRFCFLVTTGIRLTGGSSLTS
jgi:hypothetical protein